MTKALLKILDWSRIALAAANNEMSASTMSDNSHQHSVSQRILKLGKLPLTTEFPPTSLLLSTSGPPASMSLFSDLPGTPATKRSTWNHIEHSKMIAFEHTNLLSLIAKSGASNPRPSTYIDHDRWISPASIVAVAKHHLPIALCDKEAAVGRVEASVKVLKDRLAAGDSLYGITTGFGGSADTRTSHTFDLQRALLQHQQSGVVPVKKSPHSIRGMLQSSPNMTFMPEEWVRGAMLVRCKSLLNGHSAIRYEAIEVLMTMLNRNLIPLVPLRGSISASGDLQPLSYIAGAMEGNPALWVWTDSEDGGRELVPADLALASAGIKPQVFGPKEGLAVLNGTAFSTSAASLAVHEAQYLAVLSQVLTAMGVEALNGAVGSFDPFFAKVRQHRGQREAAKNITSFLEGSRLARHEDEAENDDGLRQDRYALRTASQWVGPQLEDLSLAQDQVAIECNSTTDNPLLDIDDQSIHHGGNFQAASVTSAMEKTRVSLQMFGRMLFAQCTELINPSTNNGLPPNLCADDPSTSYTFKGIDINVAAYMSELAFLANPVSSHVQTAEMGNQAINSLALISARYTHQAIDTLSLICASYLYTLCQALDLRAMNVLFWEAAEAEVRELTNETFQHTVKEQHGMESLQNVVVEQIKKQFGETTSLDIASRFKQMAKSNQSVILTHLSALPRDHLRNDCDLLDLFDQWKLRAAVRLRHIFVANREKYFAQSDATPYLGRAAKKMYTYIRKDLEIPFHKGLVDCPTRENGKLNVGGYVSVIYESMRQGKLYDRVMELAQATLSTGEVGEEDFGMPSKPPRQFLTEWIKGSLTPTSIEMPQTPTDWEVFEKKHGSYFDDLLQRKNGV